MDWETPVTVAASVLGSGIVAWLVARAVLVIGRRRDIDLLVRAHRTGRRPWVATAMAIALRGSLPTAELPEGWYRAATILVIGCTCWLLVAALLVLEQVVRAQLPTDVADNRKRRRAITQITLLRRIAVALIVLLGLAAALMSFPGLRTFGASLLASAGLAGILAGLAAQATLSNVIAGLQLAFTDALRVDDVVVVETEWGRVEDVTLTYVVIHLWDERRLVLPTSYFTTTPFQNWTRTHARVLGSVILHLDYRTPLTKLREEAQRVIEASQDWDRQDWSLQVTDTTPTTMVVRVVASAPDGPAAWNLRCEIREALLVWLRDNHPEALPTTREMSTGTLEIVDDDDPLDRRFERLRPPFATASSDPAGASDPGPAGVSPAGVSPAGVSPGVVSPGVVSPGVVSPAGVSPGVVSPGGLSPAGVPPGGVPSAVVSPGGLPSAGVPSAEVAPGAGPSAGVAPGAGSAAVAPSAVVRPE